MDDNINLQPQGGETDTEPEFDFDYFSDLNADDPTQSPESSDEIHYDFSLDPAADDLTQSPESPDEAQPSDTAGPVEGANTPVASGPTGESAVGEEAGAAKKSKKNQKAAAPKKVKNRRARSKKGKAESDGTEKRKKTDSNPFHTARKKRNLIHILIAVAVFIATVAIQYTFTHLLVTPRSGELVNWMFVTGDSDAAVTSAGTYYQAEQSNRVSKPLTDLYFHAKHTADASDEMRLLSVTGLFSPMKIMLNGEEIYNNGYEERRIVGNSYNEVVIPPSEDDAQIEVFIYYPFAFHFNSYLTPIGDSSLLSADNLGRNFGVLLSLLAVLAGLIMLVSVFAMMFRSKDVVTMVGLSVVIMFCGASLLLHQISLKSSIFTSYLLFPGAQLLSALSMALALFLIHLMMNEKKNAFVIADLLIPFTAALAFVPNMIVMRVGGTLTAAAAAAACILLLIEMHDIPNLNVKYSAALQIVGVYAVITFVFNQFVFSTGLYASSAGMTGFSLIIFSVMTYYIYARKIAQRRLEEFSGYRQKSEISYIFNAVSDIISSPSKLSSTREYAINVSEHTSSFLQKSELLIVPDDLTCVAAMRMEEGYREIYNYQHRSETEYNFDEIDNHLTHLEEGLTIGTSFVEMKFGDSSIDELLIIFDNTYHDENSDFREFMETLYRSIKIFFNRFHRSLETTENIENIYMNLASLAESRCFGTENHLVTVSRMTQVIASHMGFEDEAELIGTAAILHDVGKITVPSEILDKKTPLTTDELRVLRQHVITGYNILSGVKGRFFDIARDIVLEHHENWDGSGYLGKAGEDISIYARIVKIADVFDALVSKRSYKDKWSYERAITYIMEHSGTEFDPDVVHAFMECGMELIELKDDGFAENGDDGTGEDA